jgi:hypothetical protein
VEPARAINLKITGFFTRNISNTVKVSMASVTAPKYLGLTTRQLMWMLIIILVAFVVLTTNYEPFATGAIARLETA